MLIKKVKLLRDFRIHIEFSKICGDSEMESSIKCPEKAAPEFYKAMRSLESTAKSICELKEDSHVDILGVTFTYIGEDKVMGAKIVLKSKLVTDEFIEITTPFRYVSSVTESITDSQLMKNELEEKFVKIIEECTLYINGKREQVSCLPQNGS